MIEHLPIVRFVAWRIHGRLPQRVPVEDLHSAGALGLLDAFGKFDPAREGPISHVYTISYSRRILDSLRTPDWSPRVRAQGPGGRAGDQTPTAQFCRFPTDLEIALGLNLDLHLLAELKRLEAGTLGSERTGDWGSWSTCRVDPQTIPYYATWMPSCGSA